MNNHPKYILALKTVGACNEEIEKCHKKAEEAARNGEAKDGERVAFAKRIGINPTPNEIEIVESLRKSADYYFQARDTFNERARKIGLRRAELLTPPLPSIERQLTI